MIETKLNLREVALKDLKPAEYNPRVELGPDDPEYQKIRRSIEEFGYVDPIIANQDGTIIGGHQRYNVLRDLGYEMAQVVVLDLDKPREKALNLALNKITGSWDEEKVYDLLMDLDLSDIDMQLSGFDRDEFESLAVKFQEEATDDGFDEEAALDEIRGGGTYSGKRDRLGARTAPAYVRRQHVIGRSEYAAGRTDSRPCAYRSAVQRGLRGKDGISREGPRPQRTATPA